MSTRERDEVRRILTDAANDAIDRQLGVSRRRNNVRRKDYRNEREVEPFMSVPLERRRQRPAPWHKHDTITMLGCVFAALALITIITIWG